MRQTILLLGERLASAHARRWALVAFVTIVAVTGGGSRGDILSLTILRPVAVGFAAYACLASPRGALSQVRTPLFLLGLLASIIALHLIPLPPSAWHAFPAREGVARLDSVMGMGDLWRPLALSPSGAWNALFSLVVPAAAVLLYGALDPADRAQPLGIWVAVASASAALGILQLLGDPQGPLYLYAITNTGQPVGLFANGNHQAVMLAIAMPLAVVWAARGRTTGVASVVIGSSLSLVLLLVALMTGSRFGAAAAVVGAILSGLLIAKGARGNPSRPQLVPLPKLQGALRAIALPAALLAAVLATIGGVAALSPPGVDLSSLISGSAEDELRIAALPTILDMLSKLWFVGAGSGSFDGAYAIFERTALLGPNYLNHAHNDWLEFPIEYGLAGVGCLLLLMLLIARATAAGWLAAPSERLVRIALVAPIVVLAGSSLVDYPLRVPLIQVLGILWLLALDRGALPGPSRRRADLR